MNYNFLLVFCSLFNLTKMLKYFLIYEEKYKLKTLIELHDINNINNINIITFSF